MGVLVGFSLLLMLRMNLIHLVHNPECLEDAVGFVLPSPGVHHCPWVPGNAWHLPAVFVPSALCCACLPSCDSEAFSESLLASSLLVKRSLLWKANYSMK